MRTAAAEAKIARMIHGRDATDAAHADRTIAMIDHVSIAVRDLASLRRGSTRRCWPRSATAKLVTRPAHHRLRQEISGVLAERAPRHDAGRSGQRHAHLPARVERRGGAGVPCGGAAGRRRVRRRARAAPGTHRAATTRPSSAIPKATRSRRRRSRAGSADARSHPSGDRRLHLLLGFGDALRRLHQHRQDVLDPVGDQIVRPQARRG